MDIAERLSKILKDKKLTANELSKIIAVQRSTLSHILSGRNKPSLDLIERFYTAFPEISLEWLISGKGSMINRSEEAPVMPTEQVEVPKQDLFNEPVVFKADHVAQSLVNDSEEQAEYTTIQPVISDQSLAKTPETVVKQAIKTIIFYDNGTFDIFNNSLL